MKRVMTEKMNVAIVFIIRVSLSLVQKGTEYQDF